MREETCAQGQTTDQSNSSNMSRCGNLVLAPFHTTLGETSVRAPQTVAERASSTEICLAKLVLNLGEAPRGKQMVLLLGPGLA